MKKSAPMGPAMKRTMPYVLLLDTIAIATAIGAYLVTDNIALLIAPIAVSAPVVGFLIFNASRHDKQAAALPAPTMRSIVE